MFLKKWFTLPKIKLKEYPCRSSFYCTYLFIQYFQKNVHLGNIRKIHLLTNGWKSVYVSHLFILSHLSNWTDCINYDELVLKQSFTFFFLAKYIQTNVKINLWCISCFVLFFVSFFFLLENPPLLINLAKKLLLIQGKQVSDFNQEFVSTKQQVADKNKLELQGIDSEPWIEILPFYL